MLAASAELSDTACHCGASARSGDEEHIMSADCGRPHAIAQRPCSMDAIAAHSWVSFAAEPSGIVKAMCCVLLARRHANSVSG